MAMTKDHKETLKKLVDKAIELEGAMHSLRQAIAQIQDPKTTYLVIPFVDNEEFGYTHQTKRPDAWDIYLPHNIRVDMASIARSEITKVLQVKLAAIEKEYEVL